MSDQLAIELPKPPRRKADTGGPVYQGVCKALRTLTELNADPELDAAYATKTKPGPAGAAWAARWAATLSQARSLAGSIDRESGHTPGTRQASGVSLAALHERLDALMLRLDPEDVASSGTPKLDGLASAWGVPVMTPAPVDIVDRP